MKKKLIIIGSVLLAIIIILTIIFRSFSFNELEYFVTNDYNSLIQIIDNTVSEKKYDKNINYIKKILNDKSIQNELDILLKEEYPENKFSREKYNLVLKTYLLMSYICIGDYKSFQENFESYCNALFTSEFETVLDISLTWLECLEKFHYSEDITSEGFKLVDNSLEKYAEDNFSTTIIKTETDIQKFLNARTCDILRTYTMLSGENSNVKEFSKHVNAHFLEFKNQNFATVEDSDNYASYFSSSYGQWVFTFLIYNSDSLFESYFNDYYHRYIKQDITGANLLVDFFIYEDWLKKEMKELILDNLKIFFEIANSGIKENRDINECCNNLAWQGVVYKSLGDNEGYLKTIQQHKQLVDEKVASAKS